MTTIAREIKRRKVEEEEEEQEDHEMKTEEGDDQEMEGGEVMEVMQRGHPYGVETMGNWLVRGGENKRHTGLGKLACLSDELIIEVG